MENKFQKIPFLRLLLPLLAGILIQESIQADEITVLLLLTVFSLILLVILILNIPGKWRWNGVFGILVYGVLCLCGMELTEIPYPCTRPENFRLGCIMLIPEEKEKTFKIVLGKIKEKKPEGWCSVDGKVLVYVKKDSSISFLEPGDLMIFHSSLQVIEGPANPMEFDFSKYCQSFGIFWKTYLERGQWKKLNEKPDLFSFSAGEWIRMQMIRLIRKKNLRYESLINSLLLGYREGISDTQQKYFAASGAMHILAVSGMHVAIIYGALVFIGGIFFRKKSGYIQLLPLTVVWLYATITGMTPSVSRAAIMISLYVVSRFINRETGTVNIILVSGFFMILADPSVIHQVSFLLSYAAVTGIAVIFQGLYRRMKTGYWLPDQIISITCLSISAQLFTFPLSIFYFHQFPNYFLITNLFAVPLSGIILIAGLIFFVFSFSAPISTFFAVILDKLTWVLDSLTGIMGGLPFSSTANISIDVYGVIMIYLTILFLVLYFRTRRALNMHLALICTVLICGGTCWHKIRQSENKEIIVLSVPENTVINLVSGSVNLVVSADTSLNARSQISAHSVNYWCSHGLKEPEYILLQYNNAVKLEDKGLFLTGYDNADLILIQFCDARVGVLMNRFESGRSGEGPLNIDLLIIDSKYPVKIRELVTEIIPLVVVINRNVPSWVAEDIYNECIQSGVPCHNIYRSGYFKLEL